MKKTIGLINICIMVLGLLFTACTQEPMLYDVERETKLWEKNIEGLIYSMVQLGDNLYLTNGRILTKDVNDERTSDMNPPEKKYTDRSNYGAWTEVTKPAIDAEIDPSNDNIITPAYRCGVGDNGTSLYVLFLVDALLDEDDTGYFVIYKMNDDKTWTKVETQKDSVKDLLSDGKNAFAVINEDGKDSVYKIENAVLGSTALASDDASSGLTNKSKFQSAILVNGTNHFGSTAYYTSNTDNTVGYKVTNGTISYTVDGSTWTDRASVTGFSVEPYSIAYYERTEASLLKKLLLIGTADGYFEVYLNDDGTVPEDAAKSIPQNNYAVTLGTRRVIKILAPVTTGKLQSSIYAAVTEPFNDELGSKYDALWGFYPGRKEGNTLAEWNYE